MRITILQGIPGSGKTSLIPRDARKLKVVSADHYFVNREGEYEFDQTKLGTAHDACLRQYADIVVAAKAPCEELVVDNTNTTVEEVARYYALAQAYGHAVRIVHLPCSPADGAARNIHGVDIGSCYRLANHLGQFVELMPPRWNRVTVLADFKWDSTGW